MDNFVYDYVYGVLMNNIESKLKREMRAFIKKEISKHSVPLCGKCQKELLRKHYDSAIEHCHKIISLNQEAIKELENRRGEI